MPLRPEFARITGSLTLEFTAETAGSYSLYPLGVPDVGYAIDFVTDPATSLSAVESSRSAVVEVAPIR